MKKFNDVLLVLLVYWCLFAMYLMGTTTWINVYWATSIVFIVTVLEVFCIIGLCNAWKDCKK